MLVASGRMRGNGHKLKYGKSYLYTRRIFFIVRVAKCRCRRMQGSCGIHLLKDNLKPSGHGSGQLVLNGPVEQVDWARLPPEIFS